MYAIATLTLSGYWHYRSEQDESQLTSIGGNVDANEFDQDHELKTAPLLTRGAYRTKKMRQAVGQYGVFGTITESKYERVILRHSFIT